MSETYWAGGERVGRIRGSARVVGFYFDNLASGGIAWAASPALGDYVWLGRIFAQAGRASASTGLHVVQMALLTEVATSQAELDGGEQLFPGGSTRTGELSSFYFRGHAASFGFDVGAGVAARGRRIVVGLTNGGTGSGDFYVGAVVEDMVKAVAGGDDGGPGDGVLGTLRVAAESARAAGS